LPSALEVTTPDDQVVAVVGVNLTERWHGQRGSTLVGTDGSGTLTLTTRLDRPGSQMKGSFTLSLAEVVGRLPFAVRPVADFLLAAKTGNRIALRIGRTRIGYADINEEFLADALIGARVVVALDEIQQHFDQQFPIPDGLTLRDLHELEMLRQVVEHGHATWPYRSIGVTIRADRVADFLNNEKYAQGNAVLVRFDELPLQFAGHRFEVRPVQLHCAKMRMVNRDEVAAARQGTEPTATFVCFDDDRISIRRMLRAA
jgi:hypothetical protein